MGRTSILLAPGLRDGTDVATDLVTDLEPGAALLHGHNSASDVRAHDLRIGPGWGNVGRVDTAVADLHETSQDGRFVYFFVKVAKGRYCEIGHVAL